MGYGSGDQYQQGHQREQYQRRGGFDAGLGEFQPEPPAAEAGPLTSLDWQAAAPPREPQISAPEPVAQPWPLWEGLSRWQIPDADRLW